ncbi:MAG TPA: ABC transporter permease [bacterium]|nr:ABC transporter permease [bacterium]HPN43914.1 ABC transporter permease [bacterium]
MHKISYIVRKEFQQIRRDRAMLMIIFVMPVIQLLLLGYVVSSEVHNIKTVICDQDGSTLSRDIIARFEHSGYFNIDYYEANSNNLAGYLNSGKASVAIVLPQHLSTNLLRRQVSNIQVLLDGQDANTSTITLGYVSQILMQFVEEQQQRLIAVNPEVVPHTVRPETRVWYNPDLNYSDYMVPGIAVFLLTIVTALLSAMGLVREREIGTLEQLLVTPLKKHELMIGKIIPFAILGFFELGVALGFAKVWYHIPIVGNLLLFALFAVIYLFSTLGLGMFISANSHTQQQALFMSWFFMVFMFLMSGFVFPIENMPAFAQYLSYLNPMRYMMVVVREIFIKGAIFHHVYEQGAALLAFGGIIFTFAALRFQQRMK